jgi:hypothetical protein
MADNTDIKAQLQAAQDAETLIEDQLETLPDPSLGPKLADQHDQLVSQINTLENLVLVAASNSIAGQTEKVTKSKAALDKLVNEDAEAAAIVGGIDSFLAVMDEAIQTARAAMA